MNPTEYQKAAVRTEAPIRKAKATLRLTCDESNCSHNDIRLLHAAMGLSTETNELLSMMRAWIFYDKPWEDDKIKDELGDILWFVALACEALGLDMGDVMKANVRKLLARYPEKFNSSSYHNRDGEREKRAVSGFDPDKPDLGGEEQCP